jgi:two-component system chemotaxis response regulator CheB
MTAHEKKIDLLAIGGSAGSLSIVLQIIPLLKKEMNLCVIIVFHRKQSEDSGLIEMLSNRTIYDVKEAEDKDDILPGTIYVAPADYHLLVEKNKIISLDDSEKINYSRPSIDVTFQSASDAYMGSLACLLLSGANADGVEGLLAAKKNGALIMVQEPSSAEFSFMPLHATQRIEPDFLLNFENLNDLSDFLH